MPNNKRSSLKFLHLTLFIITIISLWLLNPYLNAIFLAFMISFFSQGIYLKLKRNLKTNQNLSVLLTMLIITLILLVPIFFGSMVLTNQLQSLSQVLQDTIRDDNITVDLVVENTNIILSKFEFLNYEISREKIDENLISVINTVINFMLNNMTSAWGATLNIISQVFVFIFFLYFFIPLHDGFIKKIKKISPLEDYIDEIYINKVFNMIKAMIKGTFLIALLEALVGTITIRIVGIEYEVFWFVLIFVFSILPYVGIGAIMVTMGAVLLLLGSIWQGLFLIAVYFIVINNIDNFVRPKLVSKDVELHPALVLVGILAGIRAFGVLGFLYGPIVLILLTTTFQIYLDKLENRKINNLGN